VVLHPAQAVSVTQHRLLLRHGTLDKTLSHWAKPADNNEGCTAARFQTIFGHAAGCSAAAAAAAAAARALHTALCCLRCCF